MDKQFSSDTTPVKYQELSMAHYDTELISESRVNLEEALLQ